MKILTINFTYDVWECAKTAVDNYISDELSKVVNKSDFGVYMNENMLRFQNEVNNEVHDYSNNFIEEVDKWYIQ